MPVSIDWPTRVISIGQDFLTPLGGTSYELDTEAFRLALKDLEDDQVGMAYPDTHRRNAPVLLSGIEYAQTLEIINGYTVTFEETGSPYKVNLVGSNNNILDVTNLGTVSVAPNNSAGLIQTREIQYASFEGAVHIDVVNGVNSTVYPAGTPRQPVNNVEDAVFIAQLYGFTTLHVDGDITLSTGDDVSFYRVVGQNASRTMITVEPGAGCLKTEFEECVLTGTLDGGTIVRSSYVFDLEYVNGFLWECELAGTITLGGSSIAHIMACYADTNGVTIDMGGAGNALNMQRQTGDIHIANKTGTDKCEVYLVSGEIEIEASVTNGAGIELAGVGTVVNHSVITPEVNKVIDADRLNEIWRVLGLDAAAPLVQTPTSRTTAGISQTFTGDPATSITVTRS